MILSMHGRNLYAIKGQQKAPRWVIMNQTSQSRVSRGPRPMRVEAAGRGWTAGPRLHPQPPPGLLSHGKKNFNQVFMKNILSENISGSLQAEHEAAVLDVDCEVAGIQPLPPGIEIYPGLALIGQAPTLLRSHWSRASKRSNIFTAKFP